MRRSVADGREGGYGYRRSSSHSQGLYQKISVGPASLGEFPAERPGNSVSSTLRGGGRRAGPVELLNC